MKEHPPTPWTLASPGDDRGIPAAITAEGYGPLLRVLVQFSDRSEPLSTAEFILRAVNSHEALYEAALAGSRYSNALKEIQETNPASMGTAVVSDTLDRLFMDWHDQTHRALALLAPRVDYAMSKRPALGSNPADHYADDPTPSCSICRRTHGPEIRHACE